ncbi:hypothetical protein [Natrialba sp. PRR66]|uniref:hypothetical protein n=1 Tax=Natrialba sp. PRR66 TaxID=3098146 RepID=UPI002B1D5E33|nr:hypothetical protein [Natrialba sp. PRR66]
MELYENHNVEDAIIFVDGNKSLNTPVSTTALISDANDREIGTVLNTPLTSTSSTQAITADQ